MTTRSARARQPSRRFDPREAERGRRVPSPRFGGDASSATLVVSSIAIHPDASHLQPDPTTAPSAGTGAGAGARLAERPSPFQPGGRFGSYRLLVRLGGGAQGEVWKAVGDVGEGDSLPEVVALKVLNPGCSRQPRRLAQFRREAERGARLGGPSLLRVLDSGEVDGHLYMTMPFVEGVTLRDVILARRARRDGDDIEPAHPFDVLDEPRYVAATGWAMVRAARALRALHVRRVAHRDVKPSNVLLDRGRPVGVYLCDLGLGRDLEVATSEQMRDGAGTPVFMAPERLLRAPADEERCDVYSMGATIFEALTLERLHDLPPDIPLHALGPYLIGSTPRAPRALNPSLPAAIEAVILKATARNPADRFATADELADELQRALPDADPSLEPDASPAWRVIRPPHVAMERRAMVEAWSV